MPRRASASLLTPEDPLSFPVISRLARSLPFGHANLPDITILKTASTYELEVEKTIGMSSDRTELMMKTPVADAVNRKFGACLRQAQRVVSTMLVINFKLTTSKIKVLSL